MWFIREALTLNLTSLKPAEMAPVTKSETTTLPINAITQEWLK